MCDVSILAPDRLTFSQTNEYDPNPRPRVKLREWHLAFDLMAKRDRVEFVTLLRPHRVADDVPKTAKLEPVDGGYILTAQLSDGDFTALLPANDAAELAADGLTARGRIVCRRRDPSGKSIAELSAGQESTAVTSEPR
jgi:hypothetical protein